MKSWMLWPLKLGVSRSEAAGLCLETALSKRGLAAEFLKAEEEKKQRLNIARFSPSTKAIARFSLVAEYGKNLAMPVPPMVYLRGPTAMTKQSSIVMVAYALIRSSSERPILTRVISISAGNPRTT